MEVHLSGEADAGLAIQGGRLSIQGGRLLSIQGGRLFIQGGGPEQQSVKASAEPPMRAILLVQIHQNDISSCFPPNSFVMVNYEPFHLKHYIVFVKICPPTGQITFQICPL